MKCFLFVLGISIWGISACAAPNFTIGQTRFYEVHPDVLAPCDLPETLKLLHGAVELYWGTDIADRSLDLDVYLIPGYMELYSPVFGSSPEWSGIYEPEGIVRIRVLGPSTLDTAFIHEIIQHRLPHVLGQGLNSSHSPRWQKNYMNILMAIAPMLGRCK